MRHITFLKKVLYFRARQRLCLCSCIHIIRTKAVSRPRARTKIATRTSMAQASTFCVAGAVSQP
jgi:hypothetical protein